MRDFMKCSHLHLFHKEVDFGNIEGYDDIKDLVRRALSSEENYNLLLCGPPASAKTLFLLGILECRKGVYFDGSNTTNRILDVLEEERPRLICIGELDKMSRQFQNQLLNFLDSGCIKIDQQRRSYDFEIQLSDGELVDRPRFQDAARGYIKSYLGRRKVRNIGIRLGLRWLE